MFLFRFRGFSIDSDLKGLELADGIRVRITNPDNIEVGKDRLTSQRCQSEINFGLIIIQYTYFAKFSGFQNFGAIITQFKQKIVGDRLRNLIEVMNFHILLGLINQNITPSHEDWHFCEEWLSGNKYFPGS